ncbi:MAG TPA: type II toxin-antitoxin system RelE/ParE family toxin [Acidobacteriaceae bacterium]|nr:type II toxin-antitoxin system RelE/ParE family toxin [Acidobacteriaceae bacterium]
MIKSFKHKGLEHFFFTGSKAGILPEHTKKLTVQLGYLNIAREPGDMGVSGWALHPLKGDLQGHWSIKVSGNWRLTFRFAGQDVEVVDYQDYH